MEGGRRGKGETCKAQGAGLDLRHKCRCQDWCSGFNGVPRQPTYCAIRREALEKRGVWRARERRIVLQDADECPCTHRVMMAWVWGQGKSVSWGISSTGEIMHAKRRRWPNRLYSTQV